MKERHSAESCTTILLATREPVTKSPFSGGVTGGPEVPVSPFIIPGTMPKISVVPLLKKWRHKAPRKFFRWYQSFKIVPLFTLFEALSHRILSKRKVSHYLEPVPEGLELLSS